MAWSTSRRAIIAVVPASLLLQASAAAQGTVVPDDEVVRPPPGTPGSRPVPAPLPSKAPVATATSTAARVATTDAKPETDQFQAHMSSQTFARMFRRRYLLDAGGVGPEDETLAPIYEYVSLRVEDIDAPWQKDAIDFRLNAWGLVDTMDVSQDRRLTGDLTSALITAHFGRAYVTLGRQLSIGGAARFTRFDGASAGYHHSSGLGVDAYGGFSVLPRFTGRPEYVMLGSRADSMLRDPSALPTSSLTGFWLGGGRVSWSRETIGAIGLSFHEERQRDALSRRWASIDVNLEPTWWIIAGGVASLDLDSMHTAEARGFVDYRPRGPFSATLDILHSDPSLFLSKTSVLSVFSLDTFTELGGELNYRLKKSVLLGASGHHVWFSDSTSGNRVSARIRATWGARDNLVTQLRYGRSHEAILGYHTVRGTVSYNFRAPFIATAELHEYIYDQPIRGVRNSTYGSATLEYAEPTRPWRLMIGGFATQSPYADIEMQALARFTYDWQVTAGKAKR